MAVTAAQIQAEFPEFAETPDAVIDAKIADAQARISTATWGSLNDQGVKYLACHLIAMMPQGEQSKLMVEKEVTEYLLEYRRLLASVASGCRVI